jgi:hypothetical protein
LFERETERQRDRETERQRDRETERQRDRETEREFRSKCGGLDRRDATDDRQRAKASGEAPTASK